MVAPFVLQIEKKLGSKPVKSRFLDGGDIADVSKLTLADGREVVAKRPRMDQPDTTAIEAMSLTYLKEQSGIPVPEVLYQEAGLLVIEFITNTGIKDPGAVAKSAAEKLAALHRAINLDTRAPYGFSEDTFIGPLPQHNRPEASWVDFFRDHRLLAMSAQIENTGRVSADFMKKLEMLAGKLGSLIPDTPKPSLLHGDVWRGNILCNSDHVTAFIDPAISYGHSEMDLAFVDLMGGLDSVFFDAYSAISPIDNDFANERKALYQLWPLLVHVKLFGGGYVAQAETIMDRYL